MAEFTLECYQNEFLPEGGTTMHAIVTVQADATGGAAGGAEPTAGSRAEVIMVDTSGSMAGGRLREAKNATAAAIDAMPDGVRFGIIKGNHQALWAFPSAGGLAVASVHTRAEAKQAVKRLDPGGGTAIGTWIALAAQTLRTEPGIKHAILLTDGKNEAESPQALAEVVGQAEGIFQCDCRGVGADWAVAELRGIANALVGTVDIVADPAGLSADFTSMLADALSRQLGEVRLRIWAPQGAEILMLKQMDPLLDLTNLRIKVNDLTGEYATGSWGDESRDYHLSVRIPAGDVGEEMLAARVTLMVGEEAAGQALVRAEWTEDVAKSTKINRRVAEAMGDAELADAIQEGIDALRSGDVETATGRFSRAANLADEQGNEAALERLESVVDRDPVTGRVNLKPQRDDMDVMILETRSTRTTRRRT